MSILHLEIKIFKLKKTIKDVELPKEHPSGQKNNDGHTKIIGNDTFEIYSFVLFWFLIGAK